MQHRFKACLLWVLALSLLATALNAQTFGRIEIKTVTADGTPVPGVQLVVTQDQLNKFRQEKTTNKKGVTVVSIVDATKVYLFTFTHPDYDEIRQPLKADIGETKRVEIVFESGSAAPLGQDGEPVRSFSEAEETYNEGVSAIQAGDLAIAEERFLASLAQDDELIAGHAALARVYSSNEEWDKAIASAETFFELEGSDAGLYRVLYEAHSALGNDTQAKAALDQLSGSGSPQDAAAMLYNEGVAAFRLGDAAEAETRFQEALQIAPDLAPALKALTVVYSRSGQMAKAAETAEKYLAIEPEDSPVLQIRWRAYRALGDTARLAEAQAALSSADAAPLAQEFYKAGHKFYEDGDTKSAAVEFENALALLPDHPRANYQLGLCYLSQGANEEAKRYLEHFLEIAPDDSEAASAKEMLSYLE